MKNARAFSSFCPASTHFGSVLRAYVYMQTHFKEKITLEELAAQASYHPAYFSEIFKRATGENDVATLARFRIAHARTLLAGGASVSDACFASGFTSLSNFFAVFKKHCGISPSEYKKRAQSDF